MVYHDKLNRLEVDHYPRPQDGEVVVFRQTHANGTPEIVAEMRFHGEDLDDAIYLLTKARNRTSEQGEG